jgi:DNA processing protein
MGDSEGDATGPEQEDLADVLRLALVPGVGPRTRKVLLERFGSSGAVLRALPSQLRDVEGVGHKLSARIAAARDEIHAEDEIELCRQSGVAIITQADPQYPRALKEIVDPPAVLFVRGQWEPRDAVAVAIVGTRHATQYGLRQAERLAGSLARAGVTIASGLARGIDAAAHRGALGAGGRSIAVLGSGVLNVYPPEHKDLADEVARRGAVFSEAPPRAAPMAGVFPQRNRIISGLALGVIVVEAGERSGALITARHAMEQGREVFAVPGRIDDRSSHGCHRLIRDGAKLVQSPEDVLEELGPLVEPALGGDGQVVRHPAELLLEGVELQVLAAIGGDATAIDDVVAATGLSPAQVLATISVLEMRHVIRRLSGVLVARI